MTPQQAADVLELPRPWTPNAIKKAYRRRAKDTHPDRKNGSEEAFIQIQQARAVLEAYLEDLHDPDPEPRTWDDWVPPDDDWEDDEDIAIGTWFEVLRVRVGDADPIQAGFRAQLVELETKTSNIYGEAVQHRYLIAVYADRPVQVPGQFVEVTLLEDGHRTPSVFVRKITQRSHDKSGGVTAFWFDPLDEPVIYEENVYSHGRYWTDPGF